MSSLALVRFLPTDTKFGFIKLRWAAFVVSALLMLGSVGMYFAQGVNLGIDFKGGSLFELSTEAPADLGAIREAATALDLGNVRVQEFGGPNRVMVTMELLDEEAVARLSAEAEAAGETVEASEGAAEGFDAERAQQLASRALRQGLEAAELGVTFERVEFVGPGISGELIMAGITAVIVALALMLVYIWFRFEQLQYSVGAVAALTHDVIATIGMFAVTQMEFNLSTIAAILTIVGYSMNDTVVVYDRIRENLRKYKKAPLAEVLNMSINHTLTRTILTSVTTLIALGSLYILGGEALRGFSFAMIWGVLIGTYSSIFIAAPLLLILNVKRDTATD
jgi:preprotein translocase SecF subunit